MPAHPTYQQCVALIEQGMTAHQLQRPDRDDPVTALAVDRDGDIAVAGFLVFTQIEGMAAPGIVLEEHVMRWHDSQWARVGGVEVPTFLDLGEPRHSSESLGAPARVLHSTTVVTRSSWRRGRQAQTCWLTAAADAATVRWPRRPVAVPPFGPVLLVLARVRARGVPPVTVLDRTGEPLGSVAV